MNAKHTPGPWTAEIREHLFPSVRIGDPIPYADGSGFYDGRISVNACSPAADMATHVANAKLIAAAPDMAKALDDLMTAIRRTTVRLDLSEARSALRKAGVKK